MCYYELESKIYFKTTISTVKSLHICWNLEVLLYARPVAMRAFRSGVAKFFVPRSLFWTYTVIKQKSCSPTVYFALQPWLQACFVVAYTFTLEAFWILSLQMLVISVHISFCSWLT